MGHTLKDPMLGFMLCCGLKFLITFERRAPHFILHWAALCRKLCSWFLGLELTSQLGIWLTRRWYKDIRFLGQIGKRIQKSKANPETGIPKHWSLGHFIYVLYMKRHQQSNFRKLNIFFQGRNSLSLLWGLMQVGCYLQHFPNLLNCGQGFVGVMFFKSQFWNKFEKCGQQFQAPRARRTAFASSFGN